MFSKTSPAQPGKPLKSGSPGLSFIGQEVVINGDLTTGAQLHVDGRIDGHVRCGQLCQGASGTIAGDISADEARIAGLVEGTVSAKLLTIEASARIKGDISYETISIAAGAQIDGRLARREVLMGADESAPLLLATPVSDASSRVAERKGVVTGEFFPMPEPKQAAG